MTQEDKQLLLQDICARLPYDFYVKEEYGGYVHINLYNANIEHLIDRVVDGLDKLVLRPMSSMTREEVLEYIDLKENIVAIDDITYSFETYKSIDWLNKHHFDYRGLIEKGLALEAPKGMYEKKKE